MISDNETIVSLATSRGKGAISIIRLSGEHSLLVASKMASNIKNILPNKVNIFVAPNGFGKTSFGIAFSYLNNSKIELIDRHLHDNPTNSPNSPVIKIEIDDGNSLSVLTANNSKNEIRDIFDIFVINSQLKASGTVQRYGGRTIQRVSLDIEPTVIIEK